MAPEVLKRIVQVGINLSKTFLKNIKFMYFFMGMTISFASKKKIV